MSDKITKKPESFKTADGSTFATLNEAELHQDCLDALRAMEQAQAGFFTALAARHFQTADGQPVSLKTLNWIIVDPGYEPPYVTWADVGVGWGSSQAAYFLSNGKLHVSWDRNGKSYTRSVSEFYASEKAAHEAVIKLRMEHLKYWQDELEKLEGNK